MIYQHHLGYQQEGINVLMRPSRGPDFNPIENLWEILKQEFPDRKVNTANKLFEKLSSAGKSIKTDANN